MIAAILVTIVLFGLCGLIHLTVMTSVLSYMKNSRLKPPARMLAGFYSAGLAHMSEAGLYALAFWWGRHWGIGGFETSGDPIGPMETFYFSLVNYTSLGLGDIYPTGHLRFIAGAESLNGFLLISCSAAFIFMLMTQDHNKPQER